MNLLQAIKLYAGYGAEEILHGVSIFIKKNEIITIIGPNGAGKSTLLKVIMGYIFPSKGKIIFKEKEITFLETYKRIKRGLAYVPQLNNTFISLTIQENLEMGGYILPKKELQKRINKIFNIFPSLSEKKHQKAGVLSGGQKQMLAIGRALMLDPDILILDEPSAGLAPKAAQIVFDKISEINKNGISIIIVEQDAYHSLNISNRGYVLSIGQNEFEDRAKKILENEKIRKAFLGG